MIRGHNKKKLTADVITRTGQDRAELELASANPLAVLEALEPVLTESRKEIIYSVVRHRTQMLHVAVEGVHDPHNTAAILRTADAFGILNVHIIEGSSKFRSSAAVTQGAHKWLDVNVHKDTRQFIDAMHEQKIKVLAAAMEGAIDVSAIELDAPVVLVFGNESEGISKEMLDLCDGVFKIPMFGFVESFNVSVAAAISMAALRRGGAGDLSASEQLVLKARYCLRSVRGGIDIVNSKVKHNS